MGAGQGGGDRQATAGARALSPGRRRALAWALARRCPACGTPLFRSWFRIEPRCPGCGILTDRGEPDYFLGAILLNLVASETVPVAVVAGLAAATWPAPPWDVLLWGGLALAVAAPLAGYPYSKTLWLYADMQIRPPVMAADPAAGPLPEPGRES